MTAKLTPKQENFALAYVETGNASEAYRRAYDVGENTDGNTVWSNACQLLANTKVAQRVAELQMKAQERTLVTVESLSREMDENRARADELEQAATMQSATMGKAKLHGLIVGKVDSNVKHELSDGLASIIAEARGGKKIGEAE